MLQSIFDSTTIGLLEKMAVFAGNNANIDTPNYKTRDLPIVAFQEALEKAVAHRLQSPSLGNVVSSRSLGKQSRTNLFPEELFHVTQSPADSITTSPPRQVNQPGHPMPTRTATCRIQTST